ncbi:MAG: DUF2141 domain-containing protein [Halioglobus sp.]
MRGNKRGVGGALVILLLLLIQPVLAEEASGILTVEIGGLVDASGSVFIAVYDNEDDWLGKNAAARKEVVIEDSLSGEFVVTEMVLPVGEYALTVFYDANGNGDLDTNFIGLPKEPIALSNNAKAKFGPPKYKDARFNLSLEPLIQRISMGQL